MDYILQSRRSKRRNNSYLLWNKGYFLFFVHIKYAHFFKLFLGLFELNVHNAHTKRCYLRSYYLINTVTLIDLYIAHNKHAHAVLRHEFKP